MSWADLTAIFNQELRDGEDSYFNESAYRKSFNYAKKYYDDVFSKFAGDAYIEELQLKKRELEKERKKIQTEKLEYNRWLREEARDEMIVEKLTDAIRELPPLPFGTKTSQYVRHINEDELHTTWVLAFGDAHYGAEFEVRGLSGEILNAYNPEIFEDRMNALLLKTIEIIKKEHIDSIYVFDLGDQIDGLLRMGQLMRLRYGVVESTIRYAECLANWLTSLSCVCNVKFRQCAGNHSELRLLNGKKNVFEDENMASIIYHYLKVRLAGNANIDIRDNPTGMIFEQLSGYNVLAFHGESKDLEKSIKDFSYMYDMPIDILIAGHLHHSFSETVGVNTDVMRTPSIVGVDDYSMKLNKTSNAGATLFSIVDGEGKSVEYHIKLK